MAEFSVNLRPAPEEPPLGPKTAPEVRQFIQNVRNWARDVERAVRQIETQVRLLNATVFP